MKFLHITVVLIVFAIGGASAQVEEDCRKGLSDDFSRDMKIFELNNSEVEEYDQLNEEMAIHVVDILLKRETSCTIKDLSSNLRSTCLNFSQNRVCEVRTIIGYFLVHRGSFGTFEHAVIWARWD